MAALTDHGSIESAGAAALSWAVAWRSKIAELPCGDRHFVRSTGGATLIAVMDGAGSGARAADAAAACHAALSALNGPWELETCFAAAHKACRHTHGVALGLVLVEPSARRMSWAAVGDIDGLLIRRAPAGQARRESILQCGGTVGMHLPSVLSQTHSIAEGDVFMLVSDGIRHSYRAPMPKITSVAAIAADILRNHGRDQDDAIVLVGRVGDPP
jgi:negative regulator of sigma-B (phosphoserine phosphatase)